MTTRNDNGRHLHLTLNPLPEGPGAALALVAIDIGGLVHPQRPPNEPPQAGALNEGLMQAGLAAACLMETAITDRQRAAAADRALQTEIHNRLKAEAALRESEQRYRKILDAIGDVRWVSADDWETTLCIESAE